MMITRSLSLPAAVAILAGITSPGFGLSPDLHPPVIIKADGKPIDTEVGHAHPLVADWDGDGLLDLLVGQFGGGRMWIYKNQGTCAAPKFAAGKLFKNGGKDGVVPAG